MFGGITKMFTNKTRETYSVLPLTNGRFGIFEGTKLVKDYSRKRDALRGAERMGFTID